MSKMWMRKMSKCEVQIISYEYTDIIFRNDYFFKESFHGNKSCVFNFSVRIAIARIQHQSQKTV